MAATVERPDYRKQRCPKCGQANTLYLDVTSVTFKCRACKASNLNIYQLPEQSESKQTRRSVHERAYPIPPTGAAPKDLIDEFHITLDAEGNVTSRTKVRTVYCPKPMEDGSLFDPNTPEAQFAMYLWDEKIKNRRRYNKDLIRRAKREGRLSVNS